MSLCMSLSQPSVCDCNKRILYCIVLYCRFWWRSGFFRGFSIVRNFSASPKWPIGLLCHLTVLSLSNPALNLTFSLLPITSSHPHASASDSTFDFWRYINIWLTLTLSSGTFNLTHLGYSLTHLQATGRDTVKRCAFRVPASTSAKVQELYSLL